jgi:hypothetical protein
MNPFHRLHEIHTLLLGVTAQLFQQETTLSALSDAIGAVKNGVDKLNADLTKVGTDIDTLLASRKGEGATPEELATLQNVADTLDAADRTLNTMDTALQAATSAPAPPIP